MEGQPASERTTVKRLPDRGAYDRETIHRILDEALACHLGFIGVGGQPFVIPTTYARVDETIYVHGSPASRMLRTMREGVDVCLTVTLIDGLVLARSAFHHSMNYRSAVILGRAVEVQERDRKLAAMKALIDHIVLGRWPDIRQPSESEIKRTLVLALPITEASAKLRSGGPLDDEADYGFPVWAGVVPLSLDAHAPEADARLIGKPAPPPYARFYRRKPLDFFGGAK